MPDNANKGFESMTKDEQLRVLIENFNIFIRSASEGEVSALMMDIMPAMMGKGMPMMGKGMPMMGEGMPMMKKMCQMMGPGMFNHPKRGFHSDAPFSFHRDGRDNQFETPEIKNLFEDWVRQVQEEINDYIGENRNSSRKDIAQHFKISEESLNYFLKGTHAKENSAPGSATSNNTGNKSGNENYEVVRIEKIRNVCPMCEDYAKEQSEKPVVIMSCEGACLRGEVSRRAANLICHSLAPDKTVRLCLGGAFTKDGGQRNLVRNAKKVVALEGCFIKCASRMMKGVVPEVDPEVIVTDKLFEFDTDLFGINEMAEDEIKANSLEVAKKVAAEL